MKVTLYGGPRDGTTTYVDGEETDPPLVLEMDQDVYVLGPCAGRFRGDTTFYRHHRSDVKQLADPPVAVPAWTTAPVHPVLVEDPRVPPSSAYVINLLGDRCQIMVGRSLARQLRGRPQFDPWWAQEPAGP